MNVSPFVIQLAVVVVMVLAVAAWTLSFVLRADDGGAGLIIKARAKELQKGWYQLDMSIANRAPYRLTGVALRRVRPRAARLMARSPRSARPRAISKSGPTLRPIVPRRASRFISRWVRTRNGTALPRRAWRRMRQPGCFCPRGEKSPSWR